MSLEFAAIAYRTIRDRIRAEDPQIDEQTLADTVEGLTDVHEIVGAIVRAALADEALATGLKGRIAEMQDRLDRLQDCAAKRRQIAKDVMIELDIKKITAPDFTVSIRPGMPSLLVIDEKAVPGIYWQPVAPRLKRAGAPQRAQTGQRNHRRHPLQSGAGVEREDTVMGFSAKQLQALRRGLSSRHVRTREVNGRELSYIEGWYAISEANRIFGFDGWNRETVDTRCVLARENRGSFLAVYVAKVRITVHADGAIIIREGHGSGEGRANSPGEVHDTAFKAAETDATKRALATFGKPFGLELYRKDKKGMLEHSPTLQPATANSSSQPRVGLHPDDTTPIPRPSHYYGHRHLGFMTELLRRDQAKTEEHATAAPVLAPTAAALAPTKIDKSQLAIAEPKRLRDKAHLKFVASQPCLVCGRQPCDPHHLRFAQPRALGLKVSDEFTVPLCRGHHRQLHQVGNEKTWWEDLQINALEIAKGLWEKSHFSTAQFPSA